MWCTGALLRVPSLAFYALYVYAQGYACYCRWGREALAGGAWSHGVSFGCVGMVAWWEYALGVFFFFFFEPFETG